MDFGNIISDNTLYAPSQDYGHMVQKHEKDHVAPVATSCHPLTKAERFYRNREFFHHNLDSVCRMCDQK